MSVIRAAAPAGTAWLPGTYGLPFIAEPRKLRVHSDAASQSGGWWQGCGAAYRMS